MGHLAPGPPRNAGDPSRRLEGLLGECDDRGGLRPKYVLRDPGR